MRYLCYWIGNAAVKLDVPGILYAGEAVEGKCIFTGENKPIYIRISGMHPNCTVEGAVAMGPGPSHENYVNNFKITCSKSNISFDLECNTNNNNEMISKPVQGK